MQRMSRTEMDVVVTKVEEMLQPRISQLKQEVCETKMDFEQKLLCQKTSLTTKVDEIVDAAKLEAEKKAVLLVSRSTAETIEHITSVITVQEMKHTLRQDRIADDLKVDFRARCAQIRDEADQHNEMALANFAEIKDKLEKVEDSQRRLEDIQKFHTADVAEIKSDIAEIKAALLRAFPA